MRKLSLLLVLVLFAFVSRVEAQAVLYRDDPAGDQWVIEAVRHDRAIGPFSLELKNLSGASEATAALLRNCRVSKQVLHGGKQEGVELVEIDNGVLRIVVIPTRGLSIFEVVRHDLKSPIRLGWNSPVKEKVHPQFINLESRNGLGWLEGFNEWMVRCGLEFAGHPGPDKFITNTGSTAEMNLTLHGKIGNIPASTCVITVDKTTGRIAVTGTVQERVFFGPKLDLTASVSTAPASNSFQIRDSIHNDSASDQEFQLIYHGNYGAPLLGKGAKLHVAAKTVTPMNDSSKKGLASWNTYAEPVAGFVEEVFLIEPLSGADGRSLAVLESADHQSGTSVRWRSVATDGAGTDNALKGLTLWKNTTSEKDGYVTGIEPGTGYPFNRSVERAAGRLQKLKAGERQTFVLDFDVLGTAAEVKQAVADVVELQGTTRTAIVPEPPTRPKVD